MNKKCWKCDKERELSIEKCECGETLVENTPNAAKLYETLRTIGKHN